MTEYIPTEVREGSTVLRAYKCAPGVVPTKKMPVFYNPRMVFNRDLTILFLQVIQAQGSGSLIACDPLAGNGVRAIRIAKEVPGVERIYSNDLNPQAVREMELNADKNGVTSLLEISQADARNWLDGHLQPRPNYVDVDPFGSPRWFVVPAFTTIESRGWLGVTATDTAVLCGAQRGAAVKNYLAETIPGEICKEVGLRILLGYLARQAGSLDFAIRPVFSFYHGHFFRCFLRVERSPRKAKAIRKELGVIRYCRHCLHRDALQAYPPFETSSECPQCHHHMAVGGPLWLSSLQALNILSEMQERQKTNELLSNPKFIAKFLGRCVEENEMPPYYFNLHVICDKIGVSSPPSREVLEELTQMGYVACRTHFEDRAIKTTAPVSVIVEMLHKLN